jgi:hypothetical protein
MVPDDLGAVTQISAGVTHSCAVTASGNARCWGSNSQGQTTIPANLGNILQISAGGNTSCAITNLGRGICWGGQKSTGLLQIGSVTKIFAGWQNSCALVDVGKIYCFNGEASIFRFGTYAPQLPSFKIAKSPLGVKVTLQNTWNLDTTWSRGTTWVVENQMGDQLCTTTTSVCEFDPNTKNKNFSVTVHAVNSLGSSGRTISNEITYCGLGSPRITTTVSDVNPVSGALATITGDIIDSCEAPIGVQMRQKAYGASWSSWKTYPVTNNHFEVSPKVVTATDFEFKTVVGKSIDSKGTARVVPSYSDVGLVVTGKSAKTSQGFNQGGKLTFNIYAPSFYSGRCTMLAETQYAFNFALTHMGSETKVGYFTVKNGRGSGTLTMRWNGEVRARTLCESPAFSNSVVSERYILFRANF